MSPYADPEQVLGPVTPTQVEGHAPATPSDRYLTDPSVALGPPVVQKGWVERTYDEAKKMVRPFLAEPEESTRRAKAIVGSFGVMGDMIAGLPAGVARHFQFAIMTPTLQALGADPKLAAQASKQLQEKIPEEVSAPFRKIFVALGQEEAYEKNPLSTAFNLLNEVVAKGSKGVEKSTGIPAEWLEQAVDSIFTGLGVAGTNAAIRSGRRYNANAAQAKEIAKAQEINRAAGAKADAIKAGDTVAIAERDAALAEITGGPKEFRAILAEVKKNKAATPDETGVATVSRIFDEARGRTPADAVADSQARIAAMQKAEAARVAATDGVASQVGVTPKTRLAETPLIGEVTPPLRTAIAKLEKDGSAMLGAEERIALQKAGQNLQLLDRNGKPFERGAIDKQLQTYLAAGVVGGVVGSGIYAVLNKYYPEEMQKFGRFLRGEKPPVRDEDWRPSEEGMPPVDPNFKYPQEEPSPEEMQRYLPQKWQVTDAATGVGAALGGTLGGEDNRASGALLGGAAGLVASSMTRGRGSVIERLDDKLGRSSTIIGNIDPAMRRLARDHDRFVSTKMTERAEKVLPFFQAAEKLDSVKQKALELAYIQNNKTKIDSIIKSDPVLRESYTAVREVMDNFLTEFTTLKRFKEGLANYLPRVVKDVDGLMTSLGKEHQTGVNKALAEAELKMIREKKRGLTEVEQSVVIDRILSADQPTSYLPGFARKRGVVVTEEQLPFYYSMKDATLRYVAEAVQDVEKAKFFGQDLVVTKQGNARFTDTDGSIGELVARRIREGNLTRDQALQLQEVLRSRFNGGEESPHWFLQDLRNLNNITLLGGLKGAATQLGDTLPVFYHHGMLPAVRGIGLTLLGRNIKPAEFGLANHIMEEISTGRLTGKALALNFKVTRFAAIDQFAKGASFTASFIKNQSLAKTAAGREKLAQKWEVAYGEDFPQLVEDLKTSTIHNRTDLVNSVLWAEVADAQPLSKFEMPPAYNRHPNARLLWQMKTYMLTQADVIRRDAYNEIRKGDAKSVAKGIKNLVAFSAVLAAAGIPGDVVKDWLSGRNFDWKNISMTENLLRNFGINRYGVEKIEQGKPLEVIRDAITPPFKQYQDIGALNEKSIKHIPVIGQQVFDRALGGNEALELRKAREARKDALKEDAEHKENVKILKDRRKELIKDPA